MACEFQVAVDGADPHALADWWAETLGWDVEKPDPDFVRQMIAAGYSTEAGARFHHGTLVFADGAAIRHPDSAPGGRPRRIIFQQVPELKAAKNRWHLDVAVGAENARAVSGTLIGRGATFLHDGQQGPHTWITLADPEGNEFCVA